MKLKKKQISCVYIYMYTYNNEIRLSERLNIIRNDKM